ncbi:MAG: bifunctional aspartate kinase/homoserine dehydrogenase I, partial [Bacteroidales bacterium]
FDDIVREASRLGYAEPDPFNDLSGKDVLRKALIIARECGVDIEENQVALTPFLPGRWPDEEHFRRLYADSKRNGARLRFVARMEGTQVSASLEQVLRGHPFYDLTGTDNAVVLYSRLYPNGMRIAGAGAGAEQTASGLINDILQSI